MVDYYGFIIFPWKPNFVDFVGTDGRKITCKPNDNGSIDLFANSTKQQYKILMKMKVFIDFTEMCTREK